MITKIFLAQLMAVVVTATSTAFAAERQDLPLFSTAPRHEPENKRNLYWPPLLSFFLPSFGQWREEQFTAGVLYGGIAITGMSIASNAKEQMNGRDASGDGAHFDSYDDLQKQYSYGLQLYMVAGELSAFHSFRTAVKSRQPSGEFEFLKSDEDAGDLLLAPFAFSEALKPTTFIPLVALAGLFVYDHNTKDHNYPGDFTFGEAAFTGGVSYNAGVGEEALFRGYMMPLLREKWGSDFWSNATTSVVFGLAHVSPGNRAPVAQALMGFYLGWLAQRNDWSLRQSIFLHAWWDVLAIGYQLADSKDDIVIPLPGLSFQF